MIRSLFFGTRILLVTAATSALIFALGPTALAASQCKSLRSARVLVPGQLACTATGLYTCKNGTKGWRWTYLGPTCPHIDPLPGQARRWYGPPGHSVKP